MSPRYTFIVATALLCASAPDAEARSFRVQQVPNGEQFGCALCHLSQNGGGQRNGFGSQVRATLVGDDDRSAAVNWEALYEMDGDADGYSNGRELGDPDGTWRIGDPDPEGDIYNPASRDDSPCGDGVIENPPEECDGDAMFDVTCEDLGWGPGELTCNSICKLNESGCEGFSVPNNEPGTNNASNTNTNNADTNNANTNNDTAGSNNATDEMPSRTASGEEEAGGCSTATSANSAAGLLFVLLAAAGLRPRRPKR